MTIYARALKVHGEDRQVNQAIEECAEFIVAANHRRRGRHKDIWKFAEEVADAEIMMRQMRLLTPRGLVDRIKREKLARLAARLDRKEARLAKARAVVTAGGVPLSYFTCAGILRRAAENGTKLPPLLKRALAAGARP